MVATHANLGGAWLWASALEAIERPAASIATLVANLVEGCSLTASMLFADAAMAFATEAAAGRSHLALALCRAAHLWVAAPKAAAGRRRHRGPDACSERAKIEKNLGYSPPQDFSLPPAMRNSPLERLECGACDLNTPPGLQRAIRVCSHYTSGQCHVFSDARIAQGVDWRSWGPKYSSDRRSKQNWQFSETRVLSRCAVRVAVGRSKGIRVAIGMARITQR